MTPDDLRMWAPAISALCGQVVVGIVAAVYARLGAKRSKAILEQLVGEVVPRMLAREVLHERTGTVDLPPDTPPAHPVTPAPDPAPDPLPQPPAVPAPQPAPVELEASGVSLADLHGYAERADRRYSELQGRVQPSSRHAAPEAPAPAAEAPTPAPVAAEGPSLDTRALWTQLGDDR